MARDRLSNWSSETAPKSDRAYRTARSVPAAIAGTTAGSVIRRNTAMRRSPSSRPDSSIAGSTRSSAARVASETYGNETRVRTRTAPNSPPMLGSRSTPSGASRPWSAPRDPKNAMNANPTTYDGSASGIAVRTAHTRRPGRSVRVVSHATGTPTAIVPIATRAASASVPPTTATVRGRSRKSKAASPAPSARMTR